MTLSRLLAVTGCFLAGAALCLGETFLVLPFFNQTTNKNLDWIGESIGENVREALVAEGALAIDREKRGEAYSRLTVRPYALLTRATVLKIAQMLDADKVIYGQFELETGSKTPAGSRGTLRITAQILDVGNLRRGPDFIALGALEDLAALQTHLAWQTLQFVMPETSPSEEEFRRRRPPVRVDAMEHYIRGLLSSNDEQKQRFLQQAAKLDPAFAPPCLELGRYYSDKEDYQNASLWLARVGPLDNHYLEATFLRGVARYELKDFAGARAAFETVLKDAPLNEVHNNLGSALIETNPVEAAIHFSKALEGDPNDPLYHFNLGYARWKGGDMAGAAASFRAALERDPEDEETKDLLSRAERGVSPLAADPKTSGLERLKYEFELSAYLQLRAILEGGKKE
ncbi:MAG: tetratricopeptide repeat protein [Bryobacteraceae bacterium]|nr:tetratricopeptide repeat protein [Bryobacteraceae bacterium]